MNRSLGITGALLLLGSTLITALGKTIMENEEVMELLMYLLAIAAVVVALTWGEVELYKRRNFFAEAIAALNKPYTGKGVDRYARERNLVYQRAVNLGTIFHLLAGVIFIGMAEATTRDYIIAGVLWALYSRAIGVSVPWLYRIIFFHARQIGRKRTEEEVEKEL